jgi:hypothetical protein
MGRGRELQAVFFPQPIRRGMSVAFGRRKLERGRERTLGLPDEIPLQECCNHFHAKGVGLTRFGGGHPLIQAIFAEGKPGIEYASQNGSQFRGGTPLLESPRAAPNVDESIAQFLVRPEKAREKLCGGLIFCLGTAGFGLQRSR